MHDRSSAISSSLAVRIAALELQQSDLLMRLEQCIPPVDQHRRDLERVRTELSSLRVSED
ncbi:MAG: hypothetical protein O3B42_04005 [Actinomycetota bacterium]|nr:hypothetical protein [Actinomycetota bacterium]